MQDPRDPKVVTDIVAKISMCGEASKLNIIHETGYLPLRKLGSLLLCTFGLLGVVTLTLRLRFNRLLMLTTFECSN
jgi:hypothetical protein